MKKVLFSNFFLIIVYSQNIDSVHSFKINSIIDDTPDFPLVVNKIFTGDHIFLIDSLSRLQIKSDEIFRIQIFESTESSIAKAEAKRFQNILGDTVYINFETPLYKLRIGNFSDRRQAENAISAIENLGVKGSWVIRAILNSNN
tara:strand:- start:176 stop:607 length:432 start_codon:yes stop_codon:yes gene_type:complete